MFNIASVNSHFSKADQSSSSVDLLNGSKFDLIVPLNNVGVCGIIPIFVRSVFRDNFDVSIPSQTIGPSPLFNSGSTNLNKHNIKDDLPAPVLPTTPTRC